MHDKFDSTNSTLSESVSDAVVVDISENRLRLAIVRSSNRIRLGQLQLIVRLDRISLGLYRPQTIGVLLDQFYTCDVDDLVFLFYHILDEGIRSDS